MPAITLVESKRLIELESIIKKEIDGFIRVGEALAEIRDSKLYRVEYDTFEAYCREQWQMSRTFAFNTIEASKVANVLNCEHSELKPKAESQVRPLTKIPADKQPEAWTRAVEIADGKQPTAKQVEQAVSEMVRPIPEPQLSERGKTEVEEAAKDSETLWTLKRYWRQANKKEKAAFLKWANAN